MRRIAPWTSFPVLAACAALIVTGACATGHRVKVDPIAVQPIHIEVDVNVRDGDAPAKK
jgi:hypothetical protein